MHEATYQYHEPTDDQIERMQRCRDAAKQFSDVLEAEIPTGPDLTYLLRKLREVSMWANISITRQADGSPRR
jgi:hypothetical protein